MTLEQLCKLKKIANQATTTTTTNSQTEPFVYPFVRDPGLSGNLKDWASKDSWKRGYDYLKFNNYYSNLDTDKNVPGVQINYGMFTDPKKRAEVKNQLQFFQNIPDEEFNRYDKDVDEVFKHPYFANWSSEQLLNAKQTQYPLYGAGRKTKAASNLFNHINPNVATQFDSAVGSLANVQSKYPWLVTGSTGNALTQLNTLNQQDIQALNTDLSNINSFLQNPELSDADWEQINVISPQLVQNKDKIKYLSSGGLNDIYKNRESLAPVVDVFKAANPLIAILNAIFSGDLSKLYKLTDMANAYYDKSNPQHQQFANIVNGLGLGGVADRYSYAAPALRWASNIRGLLSGDSTKYNWI